MPSPIEMLFSIVLGLSRKADSFLFYLNLLLGRTLTASKSTCHVFSSLFEFQELLSFFLSWSFGWEIERESLSHFRCLKCVFRDPWAETITSLWGFFSGLGQNGTKFYSSISGAYETYSALELCVGSICWWVRSNNAMRFAAFTRTVFVHVQSFICFMSIHTGKFCLVSSRSVWCRLWVKFCQLLISPLLFSRDLRYCFQETWMFISEATFSCQDKNMNSFSSCV